MDYVKLFRSRLHQKALRCIVSGGTRGCSDASPHGRGKLCHMGRKKKNNMRRKIAIPTRAITQDSWGCDDAEGLASGPVLNQTASSEVTTIPSHVRPPTTATKAQARTARHRQRRRVAGRPSAPTTAMPALEKLSPPRIK